MTSDLNNSPNSNAAIAHKREEETQMRMIRKKILIAERPEPHPHEADGNSQPDRGALATVDVTALSVSS